MSTGHCESASAGLESASQVLKEIAAGVLRGSMLLEVDLGELLTVAFLREAWAGPEHMTPDLISPSAT